jgi:hypothetical protein
LEAKRITMIAAKVSTVAVEVETKNGEDIFIMPRHRDGILQNKASCRTSLTPRL